MSPLERIKAELAEKDSKTRQAMARVREKTKQAAERNEHTLIAVGSAFGMGWAEAHKKEIPAPKNVDPALFYGGLALGGTYLSKDVKTVKRLQSLADGLLSISAYKKGRTMIPKSDETSGYGEQIVGSL